MYVQSRILGIGGSWSPGLDGEVAFYETTAEHAHNHSWYRMVSRRYAMYAKAVNVSRSNSYHEGFVHKSKFVTMTPQRLVQKCSFSVKYW